MIRHRIWSQSSTRIVTQAALALSLIFCFSAHNAQAQSLPPRLASRPEVVAMLRQRVDVQHHGNAIVVGVINKKGREIIAYGQFDKADPRVPNGETVYEIGSITKVFTSLLLCDMVVKGEVSLNDPVAKYLPASVHMPTRNGKQITLLNLATHHSGLPRMPDNFGRNMLNPLANYSVQQLYDFLSNYQLTRDPGAKYEYSNLGVGLLGHVLALRAGTDYETLLRTRITGPLHMDHTAITLTPEMKERLPPGHNDGNTNTPAWEVPVLDGAGGIRSTANDMLTFVAANLGLIPSPLQPAMKKMLSVRQEASPGVDIALGWHIFTSPNEMVWHNGATGGFHTFAGFEPHRKLGVVVLSNSVDWIDDIARKTLDGNVTVPAELPVGPHYAQ